MSRAQSGPEGTFYGSPHALHACEETVIRAQDVVEQLMEEQNEELLR